MILYKTTGQDDTHALGQALGAQLRPGDSLLLTGDLGAGKSVLARGAARSLGVTGPMPSPTFTLMQPYHDGTAPVCHFDLYRISDEDEFEAAGLAEFVGGGQVALIEWPLEGLRVEPAVRLSIARGALDEERLIDIRFEGIDESRVTAIEAALRQWEEQP